MVRKKPDAYIDITVDMDELDLTASEAKQPQCPPEKEKLIEEALRYFKMIS